MSLSPGELESLSVRFRSQCYDSDLLRDFGRMREALIRAWAEIDSMESLLIEARDSNRWSLREVDKLRLAAKRLRVKVKALKTKVSELEDWKSISKVDPIAKALEDGTI